MARYGYARISTDEQSHDPQLLELRREGLEEIITDTISGRVPALERPGLSSLLNQLRQGDSMVVSRLDRLGRDTVDVMSLIGSLTENGVRVRILNIGIETGTPNGQLFLTILAGFAQFEREIIRERTRAGLEAARQAGIRLGRSPILTSRQRKHVCELRHTGRTLSEIAKIFRVSRSTIWRTVQSEV
ncbi:recombinase family protein [Acetobacter cibinongensis]|uniref:DNA resolvase n=1 Tax=Acetobacter cibinongensis TaxID=146475 RepID=A0A1Z5YZ89_9PROT|nr:recombinase family protein [Acetobacter cibinongensis]OUJ04587.1 DNA resolvase [Acetobacter cibinongensis]